MLQRGVEDVKIFCPISQSTFVELMKQTNADSRKDTAKIVDDLSLGACLAEEEVRFSTEIAHLIYDLSGTKDLHRLDELVWNRLGYVLGVVHPSNTPFDERTERAIQKTFFDHMCSLSLQEIIGTLDNGTFSASEYNNIAKRINRGNIKHSDMLKSFKHTYSIEIRGALEIGLEDIPNILADIAVRSGTRVNPPTEQQKKETIIQYGELFAQALEQGKARDKLRTAHILASLHAALRWDKSRVAKGNDLFDFHHAVAALSYCDAFFTERSLKTIIEQGHLGLAAQYNCLVAAHMDEAISVTESLS